MTQEFDSIITGHFQDLHKANGYKLVEYTKGFYKPLKDKKGPLKQIILTFEDDK